MKLLGRTLSVNLHKKLIEMSEDTNQKEISIRAKLLAAELGASKKSTQYAMDYLNVLGAVERKSTKGAGTGKYLLKSKTLVNQDEVDVAAVVFGLYSENALFKPEIQSRKNGSLSAYITGLFIQLYTNIYTYLYIYYYLKNSNFSKKQIEMFHSDINSLYFSNTLLQQCVDGDVNQQVEGINNTINYLSNYINPTKELTIFKYTIDNVYFEVYLTSVGVYIVENIIYQRKGKQTFKVQLSPVVLFDSLRVEVPTNLNIQNYDSLKKVLDNIGFERLTQVKDFTNNNNYVIDERVYFLRYDYFFNIYKWLIQHIDISKYDKFIKEVNIGKQSNKVSKPAEYKTLSKEKESKRHHLAEIPVSKIKDTRDNMLATYELITNRYSIFSHYLTKEERIRYSEEVYYVLTHELDDENNKMFGNDYYILGYRMPIIGLSHQAKDIRDTFKALIIAANTGVFFGFIPMSTNIKSIKEYTNLLKKQFKNKRYFHVLVNALSNEETRATTIALIYNFMGLIVRLMYEGKFSFSKELKERIKNTVNKLNNLSNLDGLDVDEAIEQNLFKLESDIENSYNRLRQSLKRVLKHNIGFIAKGAYLFNNFNFKYEFDLDRLMPENEFHVNINNVMAHYMLITMLNRNKAEDDFYIEAFERLDKTYRGYYSQLNEIVVLNTVYTAFADRIRNEIIYTERFHLTPKTLRHFRLKNALKYMIHVLKMRIGTFTFKEVDQYDYKFAQRNAQLITQFEDTIKQDQSMRELTELILELMSINKEHYMTDKATELVTYCYKYGAVQKVLYLLSHLKFRFGRKNVRYNFNVVIQEVLKFILPKEEYIQTNASKYVFKRRADKLRAAISDFLNNWQDIVHITA